jgi:hypothetical protein
MAGKEGAGRRRAFSEPGRHVRKTHCGTARSVISSKIILDGKAEGAPSAIPK